uniref:Putative methyltransferase n=1 Tax=symbiont bacterium of Paederus fuscipes TaxID=176282 RepID=Q6VTA0_UNCXX|nr:putative methyltransferase [symbiont bacterium of Paederus fuscipes]
MLKQRLFECISSHVDGIGYVPIDLQKIFDFGAAPSKDAHGSEASNTNSNDEKERLASHINQHYDHTFFSEGLTSLLVDGSDYRNIGYWDETTTTQHEASERLQDALLDFIPEKSGRILDAACGMGASTRHLLEYYPADNIWAINISEKQIEATRRNVPGCHAQVMNAVDLSFEEGFFDNILCIEAAFHFETRQKFLEEARRILRPGGRLVLSDVLFSSSERLEQYPIFPSAINHLNDTEEYRRLLKDTGFSQVEIEDVSDEVWGAHFIYAVKRVHEAFYKGELDIVQLTEMLWSYYQLNSITKHCLFICAQK